MALACSLLLLPAASARSAEARVGRPLADVLLELRDEGLNVIYSSRLVRPEMTVGSEPRETAPRKLLDELLRPHGLAVREGPGDAFIVVKRPAADEGAAGAEGLSLGLEDRVDVEGREGEATGPRPLSLERDEVGSVPGSVDNVFRTLQTLPGVVGVSELGSRISVRGGAPDQNLTIMDGVEIHNPFRLFGLTSAFHPETVKSFTLSPGAFGARYGDRLSSLLVVETRSGTEERPLAGSASLSVTDADVLLEGRLPTRVPASWLVAARRSYYDVVGKSLGYGHLPTFADVQVKLAARPRPQQHLTLTALVGNENTDADVTDAQDRIGVLSTARNRLLALRFESVLGARGWTRSVLSAYEFDEGLDLDGSFETDNKVSFSRESVGERGRSNDQVAPLAFDRFIQVRDLAFRHEMFFQVSDSHRLGFGFDAHDLRTQWRFVIAGDRNRQEANGSAALLGYGLPDALRSSGESRRLGVWAEDRFRASERVTLEGGLRVGWSSLNERTSVSPRLAATWRAGPLGTVRAALGLHAQTPGYEKVFQSDYFIDLSHSGRLDLANERALHLVLTVERDLSSDWHASVEGYLRRFTDLVVGRQETEGERQERLSQYDFPGPLRWGLPTDRLIASTPASAAEGEAYGVLALVEKRPRSPSARLAGWASYAFGVANRTAYGRTYPFDYDRRHAFSVVGRFAVCRWLALGATFRYATGLPSTPPRGVLVAAVPDDADRDGDGSRTELVPDRDAEGNVIYIPDPGGAATLNSGRLPAYSRLDVRVTVRPRGARGRWLIYAEVLNVLDRKNAAQYDWDIRLDPGDVRPHIVQSNGEDGLPLVPTLGVRFRF